MSNDEEKEEDEVRRRRRRRAKKRRRKTTKLFITLFSRVSMHPSRDSGLFWRARPSRTRERRGCGVARNFAHFLILGWFFLLVMMPIAMCSDVALFVSYLSTTGRRTLRGGRRGRGARGWCARSFRVALRFGRGRRSLMTTF